MTRCRGETRTVVKPFVQAFVRPHGLDVAATPLFVEQVEAMNGLKTAGASADVLGVLLALGDRPPARAAAQRALRPMGALRARAGGEDAKPR